MKYTVTFYTENPRLNETIECASKKEAARIAKSSTGALAVIARDKTEIGRKNADRKNIAWA